MYVLTQFGQTALPTANSEFTDDIDTVDGAMAVLGGGAYDSYGSETVQPSLPYMIRFRGMLYGTSLALVQAELDALRALVGTTAALYRSPVGSPGTYHQVQARLKSCKPITIASKSRGSHETVEMQFVAFTRWESIDLLQVAKTLAVGGGSSTINLDNSSGNREQTNVTITVRAGSADLSMFGFDFPAGRCSWRWNGLLKAGALLVIDCAAMSVTNDDVDAYSGMILTGNHTVVPWLVMPAANNTAVVIWTDTGEGSTGATLTVSFYPAYA